LSIWSANTSYDGVHDSPPSCCRRDTNIGTVKEDHSGASVWPEIQDVSKESQQSIFFSWNHSCLPSFETPCSLFRNVLYRANRISSRSLLCTGARTVYSDARKAYRFGDLRKCLAVSKSIPQWLHSNGLSQWLDYHERSLITVGGRDPPLLRSVSLVRSRG
jgi:hypothetical protein